MTKKISELPDASSLDGSELIECVQGGTSKKTNSQAIANLSGGGGGSGIPTRWSFSAHSGSYPSDTSLLYRNIDTDEAVLPYNTWFYYDATDSQWITK